MAPREPARRRPPRLRSRPLLLVVCGSARTEGDYLKGLRAATANRAVDLRIVTKPKAPVQVVRHAVDYRAATQAEFDETWCVLDVDRFELADAVALARRESIDLAVSNPCFELWLLLHHTDCRAYLGDFAAVLGRLKRYVRDYDKARVNFRDFEPGLHDAVVRAKALDPSARDHGRNPSTGVWQLAEKIRE